MFELGSENVGFGVTATLKEVSKVTLGLSHRPILQWQKVELAYDCRTHRMKSLHQKAGRNVLVTKTTEIAAINLLWYVLY